MRDQQRWQRITLLTVLGYEAAGALVGGSLLVAGPDGHYMDMPVGIMHGTFRDFLIPGIILFALGVLNVAAFVAVWQKRRVDWIAATLALGGFAVWFFVEIVILRELHWLHVMWGFPVVAGLLVAPPLLPFRPAIMRSVWLACGIVSSLLYVAMNILVAMQWPQYSSTSQTVSELSAVGAPTRPLWVALGIIYTLLVIAFGWGIRMAATNDRRLRIVGTLVVVYGALGFLWTFAPMHMRETLAAGGGTFSDTMHLALGAVTVTIYLVALALAASAQRGAFRIYSIASFLALLILGVLTFQQAPGVSANQPTPLIGVWERLNIGVFLLWVVVLALSLLARTMPRKRARLARPWIDAASAARLSSAG